MFNLTLAEANASRPQKPNNINLADWLHYYDDLACWMATQAEKYLSGIKEENPCSSVSHAARKLK